MSFSDSIKNFFNRRRNPELGHMRDWAAPRKGVEGYIEPLTATNPTTLLLVDRDGDHVRAAIGGPEDGFAFCEKIGIPCYDAAVIGYPDRMRDRRRAEAEADFIDKEIAEIERRLEEPPPNAPDT